MFTGIVIGMGRIEARAGGPDEARLRIASECLGVAARGESIAVDGVCLTAVNSGSSWFEAVVSPETMARTTLGGLPVGAAVNLELSLRVGDRLGGHIVQGHVDTVAAIEDVRPEGSGARMRIALPAALAPYVVMKGSIAVDGVSLTVAAREADAFEVALIPETLERTGLGRKRPGEPVNLEADPIGRYVIEALRGRDPVAAGPVTRDLLEKHGFTVQEVVR